MDNNQERAKRSSDSVKSTSRLNVTYKGNVSIAIVKNGKIVRRIKNHNEGTQQLFKFILDCLAGNYYGDNRPSWILPFYTEISEPTRIDRYSLATLIPISEPRVFQSTNENRETEWVLSYPCMISSVYFTAETRVNGLLFYSNKNRLNLKNKQGFEAGAAINETEGDSPLYSMKMYFDPGNEEGIIFTGQDVLIEWQVRITSASQSN